MNKKSQIISSVFLLFLIFAGDILNATIGFSALMVFWGVSVLLCAFLSHKYKNWDLEEKYRNIAGAEKRARYSFWVLIFLGILMLLCGAMMYFSENIMPLVMFMVLAAISLIPAHIIDRKFWAQVPREDRPWAYRGIKSEEDAMEEQ